MSSRKRSLVVGQSGGPTAVINRTLAGIIETAMASDDVGDILGLRHGIEGLLVEDYVDLRRGSSDLVATLKDTPSSYLGSCRYRLRDEDVDRALSSLSRVNAGMFLYIGGNDSADTTHRLAVSAKDDLRCIGLPKTVDNDLVGTDHCPGYGSAARFIASTVMEVARDTEAMRRTDPIKIVEVAGRHSGWLAAAATLGRRSEDEGPHLVYLPEHPVPLATILTQVSAAYEAYDHVLIVLSENQPDPTGRILGSDGEPRYLDAFGHAYFDSPAESLARSISRELGVRARFEKPGTLQRMSIAYRSETDAAEAEQVGREAVRLGSDGASDVMVVIERISDEPYRCELRTAPLASIANAQRTVPDEYIASDGTGVTEAFSRYALPLLGKALPTHARLSTAR